VSALSGTFEGSLSPDSREAPISIVVELRGAGEVLTGDVKVSAPLNANVPIEFGKNLSGKCNLNVVLSKFLTLRLFGSCERTILKGNYTLHDNRPNTVSSGSFRLVRKEVQPSATASTEKMNACMKANVKCLTTCPRGDNSAELLCSNHCRSRLLACKRQANKPPASIE
jgi:hypothetical protein